MAGTPPQIIYQQAPPAPGGQCSSHAMFEQLMKQAIDNLADKISEGIEALNNQSANNGEAIRQVLENQADRRELCGKQNARLDGLEKSDGEQWSAITELRKYMWIGVGIMLAAQVALKFIFKGV